MAPSRRERARRRRASHASLFAQPGPHPTGRGIGPNVFASGGGRSSDRTRGPVAPRRLRQRGGRRVRRRAVGSRMQLGNRTAGAKLPPPLRERRGLVAPRRWPGL